MEQITKTIQDKIETAIYGYQPGEFLAIREGDQLVNRNEFIAYKAKRIAGHVGHAAWTGLMVTATIAGAINQRLEA